MRKKIISLCLATTMICSLVACGNGKNTNTTPAPTTPAPTATVEPTKTPAEKLEFTAGNGIDFEDGKYDFILMNTAPGNADKSELSIVDYNGSKALKVDVKEGNVPYIGIDVASLVGDKIADVRSMKLQIGVQYDDGVFGAVSGIVYAYSGTERTETKRDWTVYLPEKNPAIITATLKDESQYFVKDAKNFFVVSLETDTKKQLVADKGGDKAAAAADLFIDNIVFYDADGKEIPVDTAAKFDKPAGYGEADMSNLTAVMSEQVLENGTGSSAGGWGQAVKGITIKNDGGTFDPAVLTPGTIITVAYASDTAPELVFQSWTEGAPSTAGWAKVAPFAVNDSNTICQYKYEDIVAAFGSEDFVTYLDCLNVGDTGSALTVSKVTFGKAATGEATSIEGALGSSTGGWGQAVKLVALKNDGGTFDPAALKKDCVITVYYSSKTCPELVLQSWTEGAPETAGWAKVAASTDTGTEATYTYADMVKAFGSEDFATYLDCLYVGDTGEALDVSKVTIQ